MAAVHVSAGDFKKEVLEYKGLVLVDFYADWCAPCKVTEPVIEQLSQEMKDVKFAKVDVDQNADLASQYQVFSIPTFLVVRDGQVVSQFVGAVGKEKFTEELNKAKS